MQFAYAPPEYSSPAARALIDELFPSDPSVFARLHDRLAEMADADIDQDLDARPRVTILTKYWSLGDDEEAKLPTIDHRPVITLWDAHGNMRTITGPLAESERWQPPVDADDRQKRKWSRYFHDNAAAIAARGMSAWMRYAHREIDKVLAEDKPSKARKGEIPDSIKDRLKAQAARAERGKKYFRTRREGFVSDKKHIHADRRYKPFKEKLGCYRSRAGIRGLQLYSSRMPKQALVGHDKREVYVAGHPMSARDASHVTINWYKSRGQLAVDVDRCWETLDEMRRDLLMALGSLLFPTLIVYRLNKLGQIENPHLIWILPPGSEVGVGGKAKQAPIKLFNVVQQALVSALIDLGADAGHTNISKTKNPLDAHFSVACCENFPTLSDFMAGLPTIGTDLKDMRRRQAKFQGVDEDDLSTSAREWRDMLKIVRKEIAAALKGRSKGFRDSLATVAAHEQWLKQNVAPVVVGALFDTPSVQKKLRKMVWWRARHRPSSKTRFYDGDNRHRDKALQEALGLVGARGESERAVQETKRKRLAGTVTRTRQRDESVDAIYQVLVDAYGDTLPDDRAAIIRTVLDSKVRGKTTVYDRINAAVLKFRDASRYIACCTSSDIQHGQPSTDLSVIKQAIRPKIIQIALPVILTLVDDDTAAHGQPGSTPENLRSPADGVLPRRRFTDIGEDFIDEAIELMHPRYDDERRRATRHRAHRTVQ